ncbi:MAG: NYN domain-containing protein [Planctomycetes bacterium]|nr:NYN domain-containing protein [Planctomycetota bacterium]
MSAPFVLIDGYNLMHAAGLARPAYGPGDLERCRNRFLGWLAAGLGGAERERTTVVFDAADAPADLPRRQMYEQMTVLYAAGDADADTLIERLIAGHSAPRRLRVVSSDRRLRRAARRRRAQACDSLQFAEWLEARPAADTGGAERAPAAHPKYTGRISAVEVDRWLDVFGDADAIPSADPVPAADPFATITPDAVATGADDESITPPVQSAPESELDFWQARVAELRDEEPA